jgi:hypothetical protein
VGRSAGEDEEGMEPDVLRGGETERTVKEEVAAGFGVNAGVGLGGGETSGGGVGDEAIQIPSDALGRNGIQPHRRSK